ncbi:MAG: amidase [Gemmatimonadales bacterium]
MTADEYLALDATGLAELVREGRVSAAELLEIALARIHALNPTINAVVHMMDADARRDVARAPGKDLRPFAGVPYLAKDMIGSWAGHPTSMGSRLLAKRVWDHDSELVRRVRATGVTVVGKTNLPEWGLPPYTESELWGACRNPWDPERTPGGSSGGSAAAVAAGIVPMAGGGDGGGSIRIPASCCGLFGLKPTRARTPTGPDFGLLWRGAVVEHVLTRSVRDSAAMLDLTQGADAGAPVEIAPPVRPFLAEMGTPPGALRIAWTTRPLLGSSVHADCAAAVADAVTLLDALGHQVTEATPELHGAELARSFLTMIATELAADLDDAARLLGRKPRRGDLEATTWALALIGRGVSGAEYAGALRRLEEVGRSVGAFFEHHDVLLTPTLAAPPPPIGALAPTAVENRILRVLGAFGSGRLIEAAGLLDRMVAEAFDWIPWTPVFNATGQPAMSVPLHWNAQGLPIGVHFVGRFGDEATLFRLASQLEQARPWMDRLPALARSGVSGASRPGSAGSRPARAPSSRET